MREHTANETKEIYIVNFMSYDKKSHQKLQGKQYLLYLKNIGKYFVFLHVEVISC